MSDISSRIVPDPRRLAYGISSLTLIVSAQIAYGIRRLEIFEI
nr:MAG TPA: hypothetical protein [Caudoviricetes sp.]